MSTIDDAIPFYIVDNAEVHNAGDGCVLLFSHMVGSRQADSLMARRHGAQHVADTSPTCQPDRFLRRFCRHNIADISN